MFARLLKQRAMQKPEGKQVNFTKMVASDLVETMEGVAAAVYVQPFIPLISPFGWNAFVQGMVPAGLKISSEIFNNISTNEGAFAHGIFNKDALRRMLGCVPEVFCAGLGGALAYNTGFTGMVSCVMGGATGIYLGKAVKFGLNLANFCEIQAYRKEIIHEPNAFQKAIGYSQNSFNGFTVNNVFNYGLTCFNYAIPDPITQTVVQAVSSLASEARKCFTVERSLDEQLNLSVIKTADTITVAASPPQPVQTEENEQQLGTHRDYDGLRNVESQQPQPVSQYAPKVKSVAKTIAHMGTVYLGWGIGYAVTEYIYKMDASPDNIQNRNLTMMGISAATQMVVRTVINHPEKIVAGVQTVAYGLSSAAKMGMSLFGCGSKAQEPERESLINGMGNNISTHTPTGLGKS